MLKDRVQKTGDHFKVLPGETAGCELFYGTYSFRDAANTIPDLIKTSYWDVQNAHEETVPGDKLVVVVEKQNGQIIDTARLYFGSKRGTIHAEIAPIRRYGEGACKITVQWTGREPIHSDYVYLYHTAHKNEHYHFLTECLSNLSKKGNDSTDEYIFYLPTGESADAFQIGYDPLLQQRFAPQ